MRVRVRVRVRVRLRVRVRVRARLRLGSRVKGWGQSREWGAALAPWYAY